MAESQNSKQNVQAPQAGQTVIVNAIPGQDIVLEAAFDQAEVKMDGGNVVFEFANGGQVVLDFTDLGDAQAPNVVMPDGTVLDMQEFLASLGEKDVEPAAGPEGGATGSGGVGEYQDDAGDVLGGTDKLGGLEDDPFPAFTLASIDAIDDNPLPSAAIVSGASDEDGLVREWGVTPYDGNDDEAGGDNPATASFVKGFLNYDFGGDGPADVQPFAWNLAGLPSVTSQGHQVLYEVSADGQTLNGYWEFTYQKPIFSDNIEMRLGVGESGVDFETVVQKVTVFSLELTNLETGEYLFTLYRPLDHSEFNTEDDIAYNFTFTVTDGSGDPATGGLNLIIDDDSPVARDVSPIERMVDEDDILTDLSTGNRPNDGDRWDGSETGKHDGWWFNSGPANVEGSLKSLVSFGADGRGENGFSLSKDLDGLNTLAVASKLTSQGGQIQYRIVAGPEDGETLQAYVSEQGGSGAYKAIAQNSGEGSYDRVVFELWLNSNGEYKFKLFDQLDHYDVNGQPINSLPIDLSSAIVATDGDGDSITLKSGFVIKVTDDAPKLAGYEQNTVAENDIDTKWSEGTSPNDGKGWYFNGKDWHYDGSYTGDPDNNAPGAAYVHGDLSDVVKFGADEMGTFRFSSDALQKLFSTDFNFWGQAVAVPLDYRIVTNEETGIDTLVGFEKFSAPGWSNPVFELKLDTQTGEYEFLLHDELRHTGDQSESIKINFGALIEAVDNDGDAISLNGRFEIKVVDDVPEPVITLTGESVTHDETPWLQGPDDTNSLRVASLFSGLFSGITNTGNDPDVHANPIGYAQSDTAVVSTSGSEAGADHVKCDNLSLKILNSDSGLKTTEGYNITLTMDGAGRIVGRVADADAGAMNGKAAFAIALGDDGKISLVQYLSLHHPNTNNPNDIIDLDGTIAVRYTMTDTDGDTREASVDVGAAVQFADDGPKVEVVTHHDPANILVLTNLDFASSAGNHNSYGYYLKDADGQPSTGVVVWNDVHDYGQEPSTITVAGYTQGEIGFFLIPNGGKENGSLVDNAKVIFEEVDGTWKIFLDNGDGEKGLELKGSGSNLLFDNASFNQDGQGHVIDNALPGSQNWEDLQIPEGDGDFNDVNINAYWTQASNGLLVVDESNLGIDATLDLSGAFNVNYGSDGPLTEGARTYAFAIEDGDTGLFDTATGHQVKLWTNEDNTTVKGYVGALEEGEPREGSVVFEMTVNENGVVTLDQQRSVVHDDASDPIEALASAAKINPGLISLVATATDGDLDTHSASIDVGQMMRFEDDGPTAENVSKSFVEQVPVYVSGLQAGFVNPKAESDATLLERSYDSDSYPDALFWGGNERNGSGYMFVDNESLQGVSGNLAGSTFVLGTFSHINKSINTGSLESVGLVLKFMVNGQMVEHTIVLQHDETPNNGSGAEDEISLVGTTLNKTFSIDGQDFTLHIEGFADLLGNPVGTTISTEEGKTSSFQLVASISEVPASVIDGAITPDYGADGQGEVIWAGDYDGKIKAYVVENEYGTFFGRSDGSYKFVQNSFDANESVKMDFGYTVVDGDGDKDGAVLSLTLTDASEVVAYDNYNQAVLTRVYVPETVAHSVFNDFANPISVSTTNNNVWEQDSRYWARSSNSDVTRDDGKLVIKDTSSSSSSSTRVASPAFDVEDGDSVVVKFNVDVSGNSSDLFTWKLYKQIGSNWISVQNGSRNSDGNVTLDPVEQGRYRLFFESNDKSSGRGNFVAKIDDIRFVTTTEAIDYVQIASVAGNVLDDGMNLVVSSDPWDAVDNKGSEGATIWILQGSEFVQVPAAGYTISGDYGTLLIGDDGSYTYTPNSNWANVGEQDVFTYKLVQPDGDSDTANLVIGIESSPHVDPSPIVDTVDGEFVGTNGDDVILGTSDGDVLKGNDGDDHLEGRDGNDTLEGGLGDDIIIGGAGDDRMTGGEGSDTFAYNAGDLDDVLNGDTITDFQLGVNGDTLDLSGLLNGENANNLRDFLEFDVTNIDLGSGKATIEINVDQNGGKDFAANLATIEVTGVTASDNAGTIVDHMINQINIDHP